VARVRPADQDLSGTDRADSGQLRQTRLKLSDQMADLAFEVVGFGLERLDALRGGSQRAHGGAVLDVAGRAVA